MTRPELAALVPSLADWLGRDLPDREAVVEGDGPLTCSSCVALAPYPLVVWDANGYYRDLGVSPRASRRQLREAYQALGGQDSVRLTYVLKQLLDPAIRRAYDATPLGRPFMDDYVSDDLKRWAHEEAARRASVGVMDGAQAVMDEWGITASTRELDEDPARGSNQGPPESQWTYSYFVWDTWSADTTHLPTWQRMVVSALAERGVVARLAVGVRGETQGYVIAREGKIIVAYLGEHVRPTRKMADSAASRITEQLYHTHTPLTHQTPKTTH